jgi:hypothetical protein
MFVHVVHTLVSQEFEAAFHDYLQGALLSKYQESQGPISVEVWRRSCVGYLSVRVVSTWHCLADVEAFEARCPPEEWSKAPTIVVERELLELWR